MSGGRGKRAPFLVLPILALVAAAAHAEKSASYVVRGRAGAAIWGVGNVGGTEALVFAFSQTAPEKGDTPAPGPRVVFSVIQWSPTDVGVTRRQWFGDAPLKAEWLPIQPDLLQGELDATVMGTLEEQRLDGSVLRREVPGRLQIKWVGTSALANTTTTLTYQTSLLFAAVLATAGEGRFANATAKLTVEGFGPPIDIGGPGSLSSVSDGRLNVKLR